MQKEIFEQPESVVNTMRGRVNFTTEKGELDTNCAFTCHHSIDYQDLLYTACTLRVCTHFIFINPT